LKVKFIKIDGRQDEGEKTVHGCLVRNGVLP